MKRTLITGFVAALILVLFAVKNNELVSIHFLIGNPIKGPLSLVLLIVLFLGVILGIIFSYPSYRKLKKTIAENKKEINELTKVIADYKNKTINTTPTKEL